MPNRLEPILLKKKEEITDLYANLKKQKSSALGQLLDGEVLIAAKPQLHFKKALKNEKLAVIAEIKRKSPSKGVIGLIENPVELARHYLAGGANALSILTDETFFGGHLEDLMQVEREVCRNKVPILRKDFILDKIQIAEAKLAGASAVLCIMAALGKETQILIEFARRIQIDVLVEVHDQGELKLALDCGAEVIGVNNRNLHSFEVDPNTSLKLVPLIPDRIIKVAESGIQESELARQYREAGFDAVLIGEALVRAVDPEAFIRACRDA